MVNYEKSFSLSDKLDREALTEAFYNLAETDEERRAMRDYQAEIDKIDVKIDESGALVRRYE